MHERWTQATGETPGAGPDAAPVPGDVPFFRGGAGAGNAGSCSPGAISATTRPGNEPPEVATMTLLSACQLNDALAGMPYPARRWQMVIRAELNLASSEVQEVLQHLPDQEYTSLRELIEMLEAVGHRAAMI
jgi:hypothetical protein